MGVPIPSESHIDLEEYLASWFSHETNEILAAMGISRYSFIAAAVEHPFVASFARSLTGQERKEFEDHWIAFETSDKQDDTGLIPVVEFFLRHGIQIIPPTLSCPFPDDCIRTVEPSIVGEIFKGETGVWHQKGEHIEKHRAEPILYPDLRQHDAMLDPRDVIEIPPDEMSPHHNRVIIRNHRSVFHNYESDADDLLDEEVPGSGSAEQDSNDSILKSIPVPGKYYQNLYHSILMRRSVVQQTGKGKIRRIAYMVLVGDGNGLVGYGEGKHSNSGVAMKAARIAAIKNMDWVERFEKRTIWTEMQAKLGATQVILRPRPVGFGLRCNPFVHQILRAAGMKDISAKVWGSRNKLNVIKALFRMLHAGHAPTGMGDGVGGPGKKLSKGVGVRGKGELERARGRKLINLRK
ncbi:hypothetical protein CPC08DRAFT_745319 [Agrocybe pediades]|nr:hypothetical protein CPC08DRAFT_745319 [Agrocybe pediades]